jgi:hypothetical protein
MVTIFVYQRSAAGVGEYLRLVIHGDNQWLSI